MDTASVENTSAVLSNGFGLASWNRPRTSEELQAFITSHHNQLPDDIELE
jgi:hypothetical protein